MILYQNIPHRTFQLNLLQDYEGLNICCQASVHHDLTFFPFDSLNEEVLLNAKIVSEVPVVFLFPSPLIWIQLVVILLDI